MNVQDLTAVGNHTSSWKEPAQPVNQRHVQQAVGQPPWMVEQSSTMNSNQNFLQPGQDAVHAHLEQSYPSAGGGTSSRPGFASSASYTTGASPYNSMVASSGSHQGSGGNGGMTMVKEGMTHHPSSTSKNSRSSSSESSSQLKGVPPTKLIIKRRTPSWPQGFPGTDELCIDPSTAQPKAEVDPGSASSSAVLTSSASYRQQPQHSVSAVGIHSPQSSSTSQQQHQIRQQRSTVGVPESSNTINGIGTASARRALPGSPILQQRSASPRGPSVPPRSDNSPQSTSRHAVGMVGSSGVLGGSMEPSSGALVTGDGGSVMLGNSSTPKYHSSTTYVPSNQFPPSIIMEQTAYAGSQGVCRGDQDHLSIDLNHAHAVKGNVEAHGGSLVCNATLSSSTSGQPRSSLLKTQDMATIHGGGAGINSSPSMSGARFQQQQQSTSAAALSLEDGITGKIQLVPSAGTNTQMAKVGYVVHAPPQQKGNRFLQRQNSDDEFLRVYAEAQKVRGSRGMANLSSGNSGLSKRENGSSGCSVSQGRGGSRPPSPLSGGVGGDTAPHRQSSSPVGTGASLSPSAQHSPKEAGVHMLPSESPNSVIVRLDSGPMSAPSSPDLFTRRSPSRIPPSCSNANNTAITSSTSSALPSSPPIHSTHSRSFSSELRSSGGSGSYDFTPVPPPSRPLASGSQMGGSTIPQYPIEHRQGSPMLHHQQPLPQQNYIQNYPPMNGCGSGPQPHIPSVRCSSMLSSSHPTSPIMNSLTNASLTSYGQNGEEPTGQGSPDFMNMPRLKTPHPKSGRRRMISHRRHVSFSSAVEMIGRADPEDLKEPLENAKATNVIQNETPKHAMGGFMHDRGFILEPQTPPPPEVPRSQSARTASPQHMNFPPHQHFIPKHMNSSEPWTQDPACMEAILSPRTRSRQVDRDTSETTSSIERMQSPPSLTDRTSTRSRKAANVPSPQYFPPGAPNTNSNAHGPEPAFYSSSLHSHHMPVQQGSVNDPSFLSNSWSNPASARLPVRSMEHAVPAPHSPLTQMNANTPRQGHDGSPLRGSGPMQSGVQQSHPQMMQYQGERSPLPIPQHQQQQPIRSALRGGRGDEGNARVGRGGQGGGSVKGPNWAEETYLHTMQQVQDWEAGEPNNGQQRSITAASCY